MKSHQQVAFSTGHFQSNSDCPRAAHFHSVSLPSHLPETNSEGRCAENLMAQECQTAHTIPLLLKTRIRAEPRGKPIWKFNTQAFQPHLLNGR